MIQKKIRTPRAVLLKVRKQGINVYCRKCGSTASKTGFLGMFGERCCDNKKCKNSKKKIF